MSSKENYLSFLGRKIIDENDEIVEVSMKNVLKETEPKNNWKTYEATDEKEITILISNK